MKITILTLFSELFETFKNFSIIKRAIEKGLVDLQIVNFRDYSTDRLNKVDYPPVGGGSGMIISIEPILNCLNAIKEENSKVYLLSASGNLFKQQMAKDLSKNENIILICGHYEGIDSRILDYIDGEICIGDYILTGGEIAAMAVSEAIIRLIPGVISENSTVEESFSTPYLLEHPQYTQPRDYKGNKIPDILYSGNHKAIKEYNLKQSIIKTINNRPDLFDVNKLTKEELKAYKSLDDNEALNKAIKQAKKFMN